MEEWEAVEDVPKPKVTVEQEDRWSSGKTIGKALLCGDLLIRYVDREFCQVDKAKRIRICLPGAKIEDVSDRVNSIVSDEEVVVVEVDTNNLQIYSDDLIRCRLGIVN